MQFTATSKSFRPARVPTIAAYSVAFWIILPLVIAWSSLTLDEATNSHLLSGTIFVILGLLIAVPSASLLLISLRDFISQSGELPVSALQPPVLAQAGMYSWWRHPIYLFYDLTFVGAALACRSDFMTFVTVTLLPAAILIYVWFEERALVRRFGDEYVSYKRRTPLIVPHLQTVLRIPSLIVFKFLFRFSVSGTEKIPAKPPFFIVSAHSSYIDPFFIGHCTTFPVSFVTTYEVFRSYFSRLIFRKFFCITRKRFLPDVGTAKEISRAIRDRCVVVIFPEGERTWTGKMGPFKPEVVRLLKHFSDIPVVPVRIDGNYRAFPRWRKKIERRKVTVTACDPIFPGNLSGDASIENKLRTILEPHNLEETRLPDVSGMERVIYRCPGCSSFDSLSSAGRGRLACSICHAVLKIAPDFSILMETHGAETKLSLHDMYEGIRIKPADVKRLRPDKPPDKYPGVREPAIAISGNCEYSNGDGTILTRRGEARLVLTDGSLFAARRPHPDAMPLPDISSVTIESNNKLQVYDYRTGMLWQFRFNAESALKWQDLINETVHVRFNRKINLN